MPGLSPYPARLITPSVPLAPAPRAARSREAGSFHDPELPSATPGVCNAVTPMDCAAPRRYWASLGMACQEVQHRAVERLWLLPVGGVSGLGHDHNFAVGNLRRHHPDQRRRRVEVGLTGD